MENQNKIMDALIIIKNVFQKFYALENRGEQYRKDNGIDSSPIRIS